MRYLTLTEETVVKLETIYKTDHRHKSRARAQSFLLSNQGMSTTEIIEIVNCSQRTLYRWFDQFDANHIETLHELAGRGRKPKFRLTEHAFSVKEHIKKT